ncbi:MAG: hypothetical protein Q8K92_07450 [Leadbetterella sp.]|nr:hypothetical protein [Leadbetterella sp.]
MKLIGKKIIAREFLIFMSVISIGLFSFLGTYIYNWEKNSQVKKQDNFIKLQSKMADSLSRPFDEKLKYGKDYIARIYITLKENSDNHELPINKYEESEFRNKILNDMNFRKTIFKLFQESLEKFNRTKVQFDNLIDNPPTKKEIDDKEKADQIQTKLKTIIFEKNALKGQILTFEEQISFTLKSTFIILFFGFILRYLFYAIRWSIRTIK